MRNDKMRLMPGLKSVHKALRTCHWTLLYVRKMVKAIIKITITVDNDDVIYSMRTDQRYLK